MPENGYVSGTNVNVAFAFSLVPGPPPGGGPAFTRVYVLGTDVTIGDAVDSTWTVPYNQELTANADGSFGYSLPVRFASTRFPDGHTLPIAATLKYILYTQDGTGSSGSQASPLTCASSTIHVITYNKGLAWETKQNLDDNKNYVTVLEPGGATPAGDAPHAIDDPDGAVAQLQAMNHAVPLGTVLKGGSPGVAGTILGALGTSTALLTETHGERDQSFLASWGDTDDSDGSTDYRALFFGGGSTSEVWRAVQNNRVEAGTGKPIPPLNLAIFHACSLSTSGHQLAWALGVENRATNAAATDRACAGFPFIVQALLLDQDHFLSDQAKLIYQDLAVGKTIGQAVDDANTNRRAANLVNGQPQGMDMVVKGDRNMRLIGIYTGEDTTSIQNPDYPQNSDYPYIWRKVTS